MTATIFRRLAALLIILFVAGAVLPQEAETTTTSASTSTAAPAPALATNIDSSATREELRALLQRLPPTVGKTLKLDPTLWSNKEYLAHYPALAAFAATHPEVAHSPGYYLDSVWIPSDPTPETASFRMWQNLMETISIFGAVLIVAGVFTWLIKTLIDHRRWSRVSRVQSEVHNKLLDRFASNEDLLAYVKTNAGRQFLESAPIPLEAGPRPVAAPIGRVLWSVQAGVVLTAFGFGMKLVSWSVEKDIAQPLSALGVLAVALGLGFIIAGAVSYSLSRKLGLWHPPAEREATAVE